MRSASSNLKNDVLLQRMIHTQLLSGDPEFDSELSFSRKRNALAGRVEEVSGCSKIGKGEGFVRKLEHDRSSKHIRDGIKTKKTIHFVDWCPTGFKVRQFVTAALL